MNYLFFDVECANCLNGEGKICSFGYVLTDDSFNILKKKDILIDPAAKFLLGNARTGEGIALAYPLFKFRNAHTFPHYYKEIKALLSDTNNICIGFAVTQDVSYISYSCKRYQLPLIEFKFFDVQKFEKLINSRKNPSGLDSLIKNYNLKELTYHRSDDDALMTMEVYKNLLQEKDLTINDIEKKYPICFDTTTHFLKEQDKRRKQKLAQKLHHKKMYDFFFGEHKKFDINLYNPNLSNKTFYIEAKIIADDIDFFYDNRDLIYSKGLIFTRSIEKADYIIVKDINKKPPVVDIPQKIKYIELKTMKEELHRKVN